VSNLRSSVKLLGSSYLPPKPKQSGPSPWRPVFWIVLLIAGLFLLARLPIFRIKEISVSGSANKSISAKLEPLRGVSIFSSKIDALQRHVQREDPGIGSLNCRRGVPSILKCTVAYRKPVLAWKNGKAQLFVDEAGYAFERSTEAPLDLPTVIDRAKSSPKAGDRVLSSQIVEAYLELDSLLRKSSLNPTEYFIGESLFQIGAIIEIGGREAQVLFSIASPATWQVKTLRAVIAKKGKTAFSNVDLRVPGYVYYY